MEAKVLHRSSSKGSVRIIRAAYRPSSSSGSSSAGAGAGAGSGGALVGSAVSLLSAAMASLRPEASEGRSSMTLREVPA